MYILFIISVVIVCLYSTLFYVLCFMYFSFVSYGPVGLKTNDVILSYFILSNSFFCPDLISGSRRTTTQEERLKIATSIVRTLLKDEHVQELEEELKENNMIWDVIGLGEVRTKEESFTNLQNCHL